MSHHRNIGDLLDEAFDDVSHAFQDMDARRLAVEAESMNRTYYAFTTEQADDLARALSAIQSMLGRVMQ